MPAIPTARRRTWATAGSLAVTLTASPAPQAPLPPPLLVQARAGRDRASAFRRRDETAVLRNGRSPQPLAAHAPSGSPTTPSPSTPPPARSDVPDGSSTSP